MYSTRCCIGAVLIEKNFDERQCPINSSQIQQFSSFNAVLTTHFSSLIEQVCLLEAGRTCCAELFLAGRLIAESWCFICNHDYHLAAFPAVQVSNLCTSSSAAESNDSSFPQGHRLHTSHMRAILLDCGHSCAPQLAHTEAKSATGIYGGLSTIIWNSCSSKKVLRSRRPPMCAISVID